MYSKSRGYTLLETLVALAILMSIILPLVTILHKNTSAIRAQYSLTAQCVLEQEAMLSIAFPEDVVPVKRRAIDSIEWTIKNEVTGKDPLMYTMTALRAGREEGKMVFYGRSAP